MAKTVLIVDDKASVRTLVKDYLTEQGFHVVMASNGQEALFVARHEKPDLILLDIMMPEMDGYAFISAYRREAETPIILLTARLDETDKVLGLELGADDYVTKPFNMRELLARIRAVLRRTGGSSTVESPVLRVGDIILNREARTVEVRGQSIDLTPKEFDLLGTLMASPGRAFSRTELLEAIQGVAVETMERAINVHVSNLRAKIERDPANPQYIETVFGIGYRLNSD
ncbi:MAG: response regulator transcription factor [Anaerolineae bacterium]|nr:response regulator transcription factor [Anaerolineae bacterium]